MIETARLSLRLMTADDLDFLAEMLGDAEVMRFYPARLTREDTRGWMQKTFGRYDRDGHGFWIAEERSTGAPIGQVGLLEQDVDGTKETEVAYMIHRPHWRKGFAFEAASACRDHAFQKLGRKRVISLVRPENLPSAGVARKLGMKVEKQTLRVGLMHDVFAVALAKMA